MVVGKIRKAENISDIELRVVGDTGEVRRITLMISRPVIPLQRPPIDEERG